MSDPLQRIVNESGVEDLVDILADRLSGADLTTLLLEVMRDRAGRVTPAEIMRRYERDRFVAPAAVDASALRRVEESLLACLPVDFEEVELSPVVPLAAHSSVATVDQHRVVSTIRGTEVAADPTNGLALEAAVRRRALLRDDPRASGRVRLAAVQRVLRAQQFEEPMSYAHFTIFGMVTAGRDRGNLAFEVEAAAEHWASIAAGLLSAGSQRVTIEVSDFTEGSMAPVCDAVRSAVPDGVRTIDVHDRRHGRGYYHRFCAKAFATLDGTTVEIADGGFVDWTAQLVGSRKERLHVSGIGLDRLAALV